MKRAHADSEIRITLCVLVCLFAVWNSDVCGNEIDFSRDIRPILTRHCFTCHGPGHQEAGFSFHDRKQVLVPAPSGHAPIVPGNSKTSTVIRRILSEVPSERMPLNASPLSDQEIELMTRWIDSGARYNEHWAFIPVVSPRIPDVQEGIQGGNEIDAFVLARLHQQSLAASDEALPETLVRRLYLDLVGLLPTPEQINEFRNDHSDKAYGVLVDRLLESQHFGERWGRHWLDLARYADSFGYERDDVRPNAWRYRDWVIQSLNRNQPYDVFLIEQLAGDLIPDASLRQRTATGLSRMNIKNNESGINMEDYHNRETVDRVNTTATAMLGLTLGCAQCHSHKYDPISQNEFYQFYGFFNNLEEQDLEITGSQDDQSRYDRSVQSYEVKKLQLESRKKLLEAMRKWEIFASWKEDADQQYQIMSQQQQCWVSWIEKGNDGWFQGVSVQQAKKADLPDEIVSLLEIEADKRTDHHLKVLQDYYPRFKTKVEVHAASIHSARERLKWLNITDELRENLVRNQDSWTEMERGSVLQFWKSLSTRQDDTNQAIRQLSVEERHLPKPYVMAVKESREKRRATHVLLRGDFKQKGAEVESRPPAVLNSFQPRGEDADRLDLAQWMVHPDNPLTSRVAVNHIWKHLFGSGIVTSVDDFGVQGEFPSHPRLLDWLAHTLMQSGWDRKALIRKIVLSATYRQTSHSRSDLQDIDPLNRLLARQTRFRLESEVIRDLVLDAGGLLNEEIGGPTIYPEVPSSTQDLSYKYKTRWLVSDKPERYRRGLYIHFKRTNPYPSLVMFDSPESNLCHPQRNRSNTPLQALTTLNDPVFVEGAQALGRHLAEMSESSEERFQHASMRVLSRNLESRERETLQTLYEEEHSFYREHSEAADALVGRYSAAPVSNVQTAAWISVARALLNLDEFITRE